MSTLQTFAASVKLGLRSFIIVLLLLASETVSLQATAKEHVSFINGVAPILKESCFACHGAKNPKGKFDMTQYGNLRKGGTKSDPIVDGKPEESYLLGVLKATDNSRMPPKFAGAPLSPEKIAVIERWIAEGAKLDPGLTDQTDLQRELRLRWKPPVPPAVYGSPVVITALTFTPDGVKLVIGGYHELMLWDLNTQKLEKRIRIRARRTLALAFLPDGKLAAAGGRPGEEGEVRIYDIDGGTPHVENGVIVLDGVNDKTVMLKQLLDADDEVLCLVLSPDGKKLASGGCDRLINVWDLSNGWQNAKRLAPPIENHADWVFDVAFSADNKYLISGSRDKTAKVWDLVAKEPVSTFSEHKDIVYGVTIKADGKIGFSVGEDSRLRAWNVTGEQAGRQIRETKHDKAVFKVAISPNQLWLATCGADHIVHVWETETFKAVKTLKGHTDSVSALTIGLDGRRLASGSLNGEVIVWYMPYEKPYITFNASPGLQAGVPKK